MSHDDTPAAGDPAVGPAGGPAIRRRRRGPAAIGAVVGAAVVAVTAVTAGAVVAAQGDQAPAEVAEAAGAGSPGIGSAGTSTDQVREASPGGEDAAGPGRGHDGTGASHRHDRLPPYEQRYADATVGERQEADELLASVRSAVAPYANAEAAVAAGYAAYEPPGRPRGPTVHYVNSSVAQEGRVLDLTRPNGLVYGTGPQGEPVLLGAFFMAAPGTPAPSPAGELVVWHSHVPSCPAFFATADEPCTDAPRMLHVWTVDRVELVGRRDEPVEVQVVDPFGAPFRASVARAD